MLPGSQRRTGNGAIAYYLAHRDEIDAYLERESSGSKRWRRRLDECIPNFTPNWTRPDAKCSAAGLTDRNSSTLRYSLASEADHISSISSMTAPTASFCATMSNPGLLLCLTNRKEVPDHRFAVVRDEDSSRLGSDTQDLRIDRYPVPPSIADQKSRAGSEASNPVTMS